MALALDALQAGKDAPGSTVPSPSASIDQALATIRAVLVNRTAPWSRIEQDHLGKRAGLVNDVSDL